MKGLQSAWVSNKKLRVLARLSKLLVIVAAVQILGGHWLALQSVAWVGMIANYSRDESLATALKKTFDGKRPCALCKVVNKGRQQEEKEEADRMIVKLEGILTLPIALPVPRAMNCEYPRMVCQATERGLSPPTPPPRAA